MFWDTIPTGSTIQTHLMYNNLTTNFKHLQIQLVAQNSSCRAGLFRCSSALTLTQAWKAASGPVPLVGPHLLDGGRQNHNVLLVQSPVFAGDMPQFYHVLPITPSFLSGISRFLFATKALTKARDWLFMPTEFTSEHLRAMAGHTSILSYVKPSNQPQMNLVKNG